MAFRWLQARALLHGNFPMRKVSSSLRATSTRVKVPLVGTVCSQRVLFSQHFSTSVPSASLAPNLAFKSVPPPPATLAREAVLDQTASSQTAPLDERMAWNPRPTCGIQFELADRAGELLNALRQFQKHNISLTRIENRPQLLSVTKQTFTVHFEADEKSDVVSHLMQDITTECNTKVVLVATPEVPWFPRNLSDIDHFSQATLDAGSELTSDHPGFHDEEYRRRREAIVANASEYKTGDVIRDVDYMDSETACWGHVYQKLRALFSRHSCKEYREAFTELEREGIYSPLRIPQLQEISEFLQHKTRFYIRPVPGLLSGRDFLNALALRVFFSTQYIRHPSTPLYTPEPDVVHELMGHAPMLATQEFADFSQIIGLASLGATDEQIKLLATCYWFSVEFGLLFEEGCLRAYGAGLLSSFGELQYATSPTNAKVSIRHWNPYAAATQEYPITTYQPIYYAARSIDEAKERMLDYCQQLTKPFCIRFDESTHSIITDRCVRAKPVSLQF